MRTIRSRFRGTAIEASSARPGRAPAVRIGVRHEESGRRVSTVEGCLTPARAAPATRTVARCGHRPVMPNIDPLLPEGVYHWTATHPEWEGPVSAYAIDDG